MATYNNEQIADFLERASEIGITRTKRELGYPNSWATGKRWMDSAGIDVPLDEIKAQAAAHHDWYETEEYLLVGQELMVAIQRMAQEQDLTPDEVKKAAEGYQKVVNTWLLLKGKATNINESRHKDSTDVELMQMLSEEQMRNSTLDMEAKS